MKRLISVLLVAMLALSACTTIPDSGPVEEIPIEAVPRGAEFAPEPPSQDVDPVGLVEGFLQAMADPDSNYAVARQYLTSQAAAQWQPELEVRIYDGQVRAEDEEPSTVTLSGSQLGIVDSSGRYQATPAQLSVEFELAIEDGQWRISKPPEELLVSRYIFERFYSHFPTYFMSYSGSYVLPDLIHIPEQLVTPSRLVELQLQGPGVAAALVAHNAIPSGVSLAAEGASIDSQGTAQVYLTGLSDDVPPDRRRQLAAQLLWSLSAFSGVTGLRLFVDAEPYDLPGQNAEGVLKLASQQGYQALSRAGAADLFAVRASIAGRVTSTGSFLPISSLVSYRSSEIAVAIDASSVAIIDDKRGSVLIGPMNGQVTPVAPGIGSLSHLHFANGYAYALGVAETGASQLLRADSQGDFTTTTLNGIPGKTTVMAVSPSGTQVVSVSQEGQLGIATLAVGTNLAIRDWRELNPAIAAKQVTVLDADWSSESSLAIIAEVDGRKAVYRMSLDGALVTELGTVGIAPSQVTALPRLDPDWIAVRNDANKVLRSDERNLWAQLDLELSDISYPG